MFVPRGKHAAKTRLGKQQRPHPQPDVQPEERLHSKDPLRFGTCSSQLTATLTCHSLSGGDPAAIVKFNQQALQASPAACSYSPGSRFQGSLVLTEKAGEYRPSAGGQRHCGLSDGHCSRAASAQQVPLMKQSPRPRQSTGDQMPCTCDAVQSTGCKRAAVRLDLALLKQPIRTQAAAHRCADMAAAQAATQRGFFLLAWCPARRPARRQDASRDAAPQRAGRQPCQSRISSASSLPILPRTWEPTGRQDTPT